jgi:hypothetical protein
MLPLHLCDNTVHIVCVDHFSEARFVKISAQQAVAAPWMQDAALAWYNFAVPVKSDHRRDEDMSVRQ